LSAELGIHVCGGRGRHSRQTPQELLVIGDRVGIDGAALAQASRLVAKVDSAAVQDGLDLYLHGFIVTDDGHWAVVQQGMNGDRRQARRYHWLSEGLQSFVDEPHAAIDGIEQGVIVNLTDQRAEASRRRQVDLLGELGPDGIARQLARLEGRGIEASGPQAQPMLLHLVMPEHHDVRPEDIVTRRLHGNLAAAAERGPQDFSELLLVPGVGARTIRALAQVAEVVHGAPCRFSDPARFSVVHGGKHRHPYPVPLKVYDRTIDVLKTAVKKAKLGQSEELAAIKRWTNRLAGWSGKPADLRSRRCSPASVRSRTNMAAEVYLVRSRQLRPRGPWRSASGKNQPHPQQYRRRQTCGNQEMAVSRLASASTTLRMTSGNCAADTELALT
jgi:uncharacterized protein